LPPTTLRAVTVWVPSALKKTAEFYSPTTVFQALKSCRNQIPCISTPIRVPAMSKTPAFPEELRGSPRTLEAYARGRRLVGLEYVADGKFESAIEKLFSHSEVDYVQVNSTTAGCFTFRIERPAVQQ
jgi:hypothetical protein